MKDIRDLLSYLDVARDLESSIMELTEIEEHALAEISDIEHRAYPSFIPPNQHPERVASEKTSSSLVLGGFVGAICGFVFEICLEWYKVEESGGSLAWAGNFLLFLVAASICAIIGAAIGAAIAVIVGSSSARKAQEELEEENRRAHELWEEELRRKKQEDAAAVIQFKEDTAILDDLKKTMKKMLDEHYSNGPIYRKYRTLPAICQLYEYFDSGRFTELGDAYNQYELEVRLDRLIDNSEKALQVLYQIRENQRLLFDALLAVRDSVYSVNGNIDRCIQKLDYIAYSQEISALCLQQTATATTLLSQIEYYRQRHDLPLLLHGYEGYLLGINAKIASRKRRLGR